MGNAPFGLASPLRPKPANAAPYRDVPLVCPHQRGVPLGSAAVLAVAQPLSAAGDGTLPSDVMPYQILFSAPAWAALTQAGVALVPPADAHSTLTSMVGS